MGTALTIKSNDPCDPDHTFEVFHSDVRDRFIGVDCGMSAPHSVSGRSRKCRLSVCRSEASVRT
jgi:hypothetical protein